MYRKFILTTPQQQAAFTKQIASATGLPLEVIVRPYVPKRSLTQNARLWLLHGAAAPVVGCSSEQMHEDMLCHFFGYNEIRMPSGDIKRIPLRRSSDLNKQEFREFMDNVENFYGSELAVWLDQYA